jgi:exonuclease SbcD
MERAREILCVGDMHLGKRPSGLPEREGAGAASAQQLGPAAALRALVQLAREREVAAVLFAGDLVQSENQHFEAYGPLRAAAESLTQAGIEVLAVAGNHDVEVLPRLARELPAVRLLGARGTWELVELAHVRARVLGWSFPARHVARSPFADPLPDLPPGSPILGLLHGDLDAGASRYAPMRSAELERHPQLTFALGHVHVPSFDARGARRGYLGSLSPLDPSETGRHGPWLLRPREGGFEAEHVPLAPLRFERVRVDAAELAPDEGAAGAIVRAARARAEQLERAGELAHVRALGLRLELAGRSARAAELRAELAREDAQALSFEHGSTLVYACGPIAHELRPALELAELARGADPMGALARELLALEAPQTEAGRALLGAARAALEPATRHVHFGALEAAALEETELRALLARAGWTLLEALEEQRAGR